MIKPDVQTVTPIIPTWAVSLKKVQEVLGMNDADFEQLLMQDNKYRLARPVAGRVRGPDGKFLPTGKQTGFKDVRDAQGRRE